jgi:hypothetical protein|tara:strand:+ start:167 stop:451 length:285 start_codon:yes stop_codon:yes gene_type:complete
MVAGDVVQGVSAVGADIQFRPAATVECMISTTSAGSGIGYTTLRDASGSVTIYQFPNTNTSGQMNLKLFITNTVWIDVALQGGQNVSFTGIQIK